MIPHHAGAGGAGRNSQGGSTGGTGVAQSVLVKMLLFLAVGLP
jgi:hypothetical protein